MTDAIKCDKCGEYADTGIQVGIGEGAHFGEAERKDHVCEQCHQKLKQWFSKYCDE